MPFCAFCRSALPADRSGTESCVILRSEQIGIICRLLSGVVRSCLYRSAVIFRRSIQIIPYNSKRSNVAQCIVICPMYCLPVPNVLFNASGNRYMPFCDGIRPFCPIRIGAAYFGLTSLYNIHNIHVSLHTNIHTCLHTAARPGLHSSRSEQDPFHAIPFDITYFINSSLILH